MSTARPIVHLVLHVVIPVLVARCWCPERWGRVAGIMLATMVVDLDHLLADPVYDPNRCSLGFHPLHAWPALTVYAVGVFWRPLRWVALGLLIHMALDGADCVWQAWSRV